MLRSVDSLQLYLESKGLGQQIRVGFKDIRDVATFSTAEMMLKDPEFKRESKRSSVGSCIPWFLIQHASSFTGFSNMPQQRKSLSNYFQHR